MEDGSRREQKGEEGGRRVERVKKGKKGKKGKKEKAGAGVRVRVGVRVRTTLCVSACVCHSRVRICVFLGTRGGRVSVSSSFSRTVTQEGGRGSVGGSVLTRRRLRWLCQCFLCHNACLTLLNHSVRVCLCVCHSRVRICIFLCTGSLRRCPVSSCT